MEHQVVIVGAGPTGLMLAGWLARQGIRPLLLDKKEGIVSETRALGVQARTLEIYEMLGLSERAVREGLVTQGLTLWSEGRKVARADLQGMGEGQSPYPYLLMLPQNLNEALLLDHFRRFGGEVRWEAELLDFSAIEGGYRVRWNGGETTCRYLCGCDGGGSKVRSGSGIAFEGGTYERYFYVADVEASGALQNREINLCLQSEMFEAFFPMPGEHRYRVVGVLPEALNDKPDLTFEDVRPAAEERFRLKVDQVYSFTRYRVHHRKAARFRQGGVFLCGDAAHVHSPVGAQGMNTGLMDASNLGWKLGRVLNGLAPERLLDTYALEREPFARFLVATTDQVFVAVSDAGWIGRIFRGLVMPNVFRLLSSLRFTRRLMFQLISQIRVQYRASPLSCGGGERLPWAGDNYAVLRSLDWQVHVYGGAAADFSVACHVFAASPRFRRGWFYLVRPDGYVAMKSREAEPVRDYLRRWGVVE